MTSGAECETGSVEGSIFAVGSLDALRSVLGEELLAELGAGADVVVLPTAAAFTGAANAVLEVLEACDAFDFALEALMVSDRPSANEPHFAQRIRSAQLVVLCDGSSLHARTVWRETLVGEALDQAQRIVAVGSVSSVLGEIMIDPRGGAPTTGLGLFRGVTFCQPQSDEQMQRTRSLLDDETMLVVLGARGALAYREETWRVLRSEDVAITRGEEVVSL